MDLKKMSQKALERKSNKPIMEKKRRARINHCLNQLKALILETDNERSRHSKLEKADILEMTVRYLQTVRTYHLHLHQLQQLTNQTSNQNSPTANNTTAANLHHQHLHQQLPQLHQQLNLHHHHHHQQLPANLQLQSPHSPTWRPW